MSEAATATRPKAIWWLAIIATLVASALACAISILTGDEITTADDFAKHGGQWTSLAELYYVLAVCTAVWLLTWLAFYLLFFRKRAKPWKSIVALFAMLPLVFIIGILARVGTFEYYWNLDRDRVAEVRHQSALQITALRDRIARESGELRVDRGIPALHSEADLISALKNIREERQRLQTYRTQLLLQLRQTKAQIEKLDVYGEIKQEALQHYDEMLSPNSNSGRHFALNFQLLQLQESALVYLQQHRSAWRPTAQGLEFNDGNTMQGFDAIMHDAYGIIPQLDHLEGEGGAGFGADQGNGN